MVIKSGPQSNVERQRRFRERNPRYYADIKARERASVNRGMDQVLAGIRAAAMLGVTTPDVACVTVPVAIAPVTVETVPTTTELVPAAIVAPAIELASPTTEIVADSADVFLRIRPASPSPALAA